MVRLRLCSIIMMVVLCEMFRLVSRLSIFIWWVILRNVVGLFSSRMFVFCVRVIVIYICCCWLLESLLMLWFVSLVMLVVLRVLVIIL